MKRAVLVLLCAAAVLCLAASFTSAITTDVNPGEVFTISEVVPPGYIVMFAFQLNPEYLLSVSINDRDSGKEFHVWKDRPSGAINIPSDPKKRVLQVHFNNVDSLLTSIYVNFDIRMVQDPDYNVDSQLDPIESKVQDLFAKFQVVKALQDTMRYQQKDHRATVEDANERVLLWSILQVVGFVVVLAVQLYLLKRFLEKKQTV